MQVAGSYQVSMVASILMILVAWGCLPSNPNTTAATSPEERAKMERQIQELLTLGDSAVTQKSYETAIAHLGQAGDIGVQLEDWNQVYDLGLEVFNLGYDLMNYKEAKLFLESYLSAMPTEQDTNRAKLAELLGFVAYEESDIARALDYYKQSATTWEQYPMSVKLLRSYNMMGILYTILGDYPLAERIYREAIAISKMQLDPIRESDNYFNLGKASLAQDKWQEALEAYEKGQNIRPLTDGYFEFAMAEAKLAGGAISEAQQLANKALQVVRAMKGQSSLNPISLSKLMGEIAAAQKDYPKAVYAYQQALNDALENYPPHHREIGKLHFLLGETFLDQKLDNLALDAYQNALMTFVPGFNPQSLEDQPETTALPKEVWIMEALRGKGKVWLRKFEQDNALADLETAARHLETAVLYIEQIKLSYSEQEAKLFLGDYAIAFIELAIEANLALWKHNEDAAFLEKAYGLAQRSTAFLLREMVSDQQALRLGGVPGDQIEKLQSLNRRIQANRAAVWQENDSLASDHFNLVRNKEKLLDSIQTQYPKYQTLRYNLEALPISEIQAHLQPGELVLQYFVGQSKFVLFAISKDSLWVHQEALDPEFEQTIAKYRQTLTDLRFIRSNPALAESQFLRSSKQLYDWFVQPGLEKMKERDSISTLIVIPDGQLNTVVFDCLVHQQTESWLNPAGFLINKYNIRYAYHAGMIQTGNKEQNSSRFLGFGIEYDENTLEYLEDLAKDSISNPVLKEVFRNGKLTKLKFSDQEVEDIARLVGGKAIVNTGATKKRFLQYAKDYDVVHIAAHAFIQNDEDNQASIIFNRGAESEDFFLEMKEIYGLNLPTEMMVLSACQTGMGELRRSEGVMSLARAFTVAGSQSVLASHWNISDETTATIMKRYYVHLQDGLQKDEALAKAKMEFLTDDQLSGPAYRIPAFWAATTLVGQADPIYFESVRTTWLPYAIAGGLFMGLLFYYFWRKNRR